MHYEEAVFLQKLHRKGEVTRVTIVDSFLEAFPYGADLFGMTESQYEEHIDKHSAQLLGFVKDQFGIEAFSNDN